MHSVSLPPRPLTILSDRAKLSLFPSPFAKLQPHVSTEAKLNAIDAMELPHTDQRCDLVNR
jgi:hypothetical protein